MSKKSIICWWSGGITSAVATKIAIDIYGKENCRVIMIDTHNEHPDTYRFKDDCAKWYDIPIETITAIGQDYDSIQDVWIRHKSLNVATGAICSTQLKRRVREKWQKTTEYDHQVFGFEFDKKEFNRALSMTMNHSGAKPIYPLLMMGLNEVGDCVTVTPTHFRYVDGEEPGVIIGWINYPRFPREPEEIKERAFNLAKHLMMMLNQERMSITTPDETYMLERDEI